MYTLIYSIRASLFLQIFKKKLIRHLLI